MGDSRRSTLVSRLPIFRHSIGRRRQDSLPSSPSSNNTIGFHSSSPSSTNSSSGSTGKRRSIFRTPSLVFHHRKKSDQKLDSTSHATNLSNGAQASQSNSLKVDLEEQSKTKGRSYIAVPSSSRKKITRSHTEDFEKRKDHSSNRNVFTNCIGKSERDDSGYSEEHSKHSIKHSTRKLLPRSFSTNYRFSKHSSQSQSPSLMQNSQEIQKHCFETEPSVKPVLPITSESTDYTEISLQSPLVSTDHTTAPQTPSDFTFMDDSASEADILPNSGNQQPHKQHFCQAVSTSQTLPCPDLAATQANKDPNIIENTTQCDSEHKDETDVDRTYSNHSLTGSSACQAKVLLPISELSTNDVPSIENGTVGQHVDSLLFPNGTYSVSTESLPKKHETSVDGCEVSTGRPEPPQSISESKNICSPDPQMPLMHHGPARVNYASSLSPFREGRYSERRLRSSSEGTSGSSRMTYKPKEGNVEEGSCLRKQRTISTSSKMNSMDVLNNLGSCELDEDDLMLDLEFTEEQYHRRVCREDSYQSIVSCSAVVLSHVEPTSETKTSNEEESKIAETTTKNLFLHLPKESDAEDAKSPRVCPVPSSPSVEWPFLQEDGAGLESLPFRLMMQDCTSVKTALLKMKRILQESADMSPASSTTSLPISPITERNLPFKDIMKDECSMLKLQLKERDELIFQLREELDKTRSLQSSDISRQDKSTQTDFLSHDVQRNPPSTEGSIYKAIRPVHCFQHYQFKTNIWTQDALH
ncbi:serine-rich coiled-coil domain-containing protein 1 isoform X2 [Spea bombifrons]|nr:serine-rich coiled-coil domain-containing protein 1 isoform X2 [Spea bombifrons]